MPTVLATTKGLAGNAVLHHAERVPLRLGAFVRTLERVIVLGQGDLELRSY